MTADSSTIAKYQSILNSNGLGHKIIKNVVVSGPLQGENVGSICTYVTLEVTDPNQAKLELFVKSLPTNSVHAEQMKDFDVFGKESAFFNGFLKDLQVFYVEKSGSKPMDFFPTCFYADDKEVVLENLVKTHGFYLSPKTQRQDLEHATKTVENLATFHAVNYSFVQELGEDVAFTKYGCCFKELLYKADNPFLADMFDNCKKTAFGLLNNYKVTDGEHALKSLTLLGENLTERIINLVSTSKIYNVINHGDSWNNNMMFVKDANTGKIKSQVLLDFQVTRYGSPNLDLTYYMFTSLQLQVRSTHWKNLLKLYFNKFSSIVQQLTKKGIPCSFEEFVVDFKEKALLGFWTNIFFSTGVEALGGLDPHDMEGDMMSFFQTAISKWIQENPDKAKKCTEELVELVKEYEGILGSN